MKRMSRMFAVLALGTIASVPARSASAQILYDFTGSYGTMAVSAANSTRGFEFTLSASKTLTGLGFWDKDSDGLLHDHQIGLWDSGGTLLSTATVTNASTVVAGVEGFFSRWLFETIASVTLGPGTYTLGSFMPPYSDPFWIRNQGTIAMADASMGAAHLYTLGDSLTRPVISTSLNCAYGPNAMFGSPSSVPEASSFALLLAGAVPLGHIARKRLRRKS